MFLRTKEPTLRTHHKVEIVSASCPRSHTPPPQPCAPQGLAGATNSYELGLQTFAAHLLVCARTSLPPPKLPRALGAGSLLHTGTLAIMKGLDRMNGSETQRRGRMH